MLRTRGLERSENGDGGAELLGTVSHAECGHSLGEIGGAQARSERAQTTILV